MTSDLLQPTLDRAPNGQALYSTTALFVPAFFGGAAAAAVMFGLNSARARRLPRDAAWLIAGAALALAAPWLALLWWDVAATQLRYIVRGAGLAAAVLFWFRHRSLYRAQELFGGTVPSGWLPGFTALCAGLAVNTVIALNLFPPAAR